MALTKANNRMIDGASVNVLDYGADPTGTTDSQSAIQSAITAVGATGKAGKVFIPAGTYKVDSGITLDASEVSLEGNSAILDFSALSTGNAITVTGADINYSGNPYFNSVNFIQGLTIKGPAKGTSGTAGIRFTGSTSLLGSNDFCVRDCTIYDFQNGIEMGEVAYHLLFQHLNIFQCDVCVTGEQHSNTGARNVFYKCTFYNSDYGFALYNASASTSITDSILAGLSTVSILIDAGHLSVSNCDFETGGSHGANYRLLWQTDDALPSYAYINLIGNQFIVKNATTSPIFGIDGACQLKIYGGTIFANASSTGGLFGSTGTGVGNVSAFAFHIDIGSNPTENFGAATVETYIHRSTTNAISAVDTDASFNELSAYNSVISRNGIFGNNNNSVSVASTGVFTSIGVGTANGLLVVRDGTSGGMGLFLCDASAGVVSVSNAVTGLTTSYSGGQLGFTLASGTVPRTLRWTMVQTATT